MRTSGYGIFSNGALGELDEMAKTATEQGIVKTRACEVCGREQPLLVTWPELYALQFNVLPQELGRMIGRPDLFPTTWKYNVQHRCYHPEFVHCGKLIMYDFTPRECSHDIDAATRNGTLGRAELGVINAIAPAINHIVQSRRAHG